MQLAPRCKLAISCFVLSKVLSHQPLCTGASLLKARLLSCTLDALQPGAAINFMLVTIDNKS